MPRLPRFTPAGLPLHITQRGNYRQNVFLTDYDRRFFLDRLDFHSASHHVRVVAYCLMTNHFHLVAIPDTDDGTSAMMQALTSEYARILNLRHDLRGHLWQSRFNSCVMDESHVGFTLAYVERNPVRAGMTEHPTDYAWSSAGVHTGATRAPAWLDTRPFDQRFTHRDWASILSESRDDRNQLAAVRSATRNNEPLGSPDFVQTLEFVHSRRLLRRPPGRPSKPQLQAAG